MEPMKGLLPRMEAREWRGKPGTFTYRYHPIVGKPINLGPDKAAAIRKVLDMNGRSDDAGTVAHYWRLYQESAAWARLAERTQADYRDYWKALEPVFGAAPIGLIVETDIARYLRRERASAPKRANREISLLSNICTLAIDHGAVRNNPCRGKRAGGVARNHEQPRTTLPIADELPAFLDWLRTRGRQWSVIAAMAEFAARSGARRTEFLKATVFQVRGAEARLSRAKQRDGHELLDVIELSSEALAVIAAVRRENCEYLFPNRSGRAYTDGGFHTMWKKAMRAAITAGIVTRRFTFHDLRAHYATVSKTETGAYPALHKNEATTSRIYDRRTEIKRKSL